jgi:hypothetical protein
MHQTDETNTLVTLAGRTADPHQPHPQGYGRCGSATVLASSGEFKIFTLSLIAINTFNCAAATPIPVLSEHLPFELAWVCEEKGSADQSLIMERDTRQIKLPHPCKSAKHHTQRELNFWYYHRKIVQIHLPEAATLSTGHHASLRVGLVPVEPLLRPWQGRIKKLCEHAT